MKKEKNIFKDYVVEFICMTIGFILGLIVIYGLLLNALWLLSNPRDALMYNGIVVGAYLLISCSKIAYRKMKE